MQLNVQVLGCSCARLTVGFISILSGIGVRNILHPCELFEWQNEEKCESHVKDDFSFLAPRQPNIVSAFRTSPAPVQFSIWFFIHTVNNIKPFLFWQ